MPKASKDQQAEAAIKSAILRLIGAAAVERVHVHAGEDYQGEPELSVAIFMKAGQTRITGAQLLDAIVAAVHALREIEDDRIPYVTFIAPEDESAEDTRPAA
jgi:hypothetical protein